MPRERAVFVRLEVKDAEAAKAALRRIGKDGEQALRAIERASPGASRGLRALDTGARRARAGFAGLQRTVFSLRGALASLGLGLSARAAVQAFAAFERGLIGVGKTADLSGRQLDALGQGVQEISRTVPVATKELLEIAQAAGQLGVKGVDNILVFTDTVGKLGLASNLAGEEAATSLARILTVTGTAVADVDRLGAVIVRLGNNFAATEREIADVATRTAQATAQFGVGAAEVAGIAAALRAVGVAAEAGGTVIGRAFQAINDALRAGGAEMRALEQVTGQTGEALREAFFDGRATEVFQAFVDGLGRIHAGGGDVAAALETMGLVGVRIVQVMGTLATRSDVLGDALRQANDEFARNEALNREAFVAAQSFSAQMQLVLNAVDETAVEIGRALAPAILDATQNFRDFVLEAKETGELTRLARELGEAFEFVVDNLDAVTVAASTLIGLNIGSKFGIWGSAIGTVVGLLGGLALTMDAAASSAEQLAARIAEESRALGVNSADFRENAAEVLKAARARQALLEVNLAQKRAEIAALQEESRRLRDPTLAIPGAAERLREIAPQGRELESAIKVVEGELEAVTIAIVDAEEKMRLLGRTMTETGGAADDAAGAAEGLGGALGDVDEKAQKVVDALRRQNQHLAALARAGRTTGPAVDRVNDAFEVLNALQQAGVDTNVTLNELLAEGTEILSERGQVIAGLVTENREHTRSLERAADAERERARAAAEAAREAEEATRQSAERLTNIGADAIAKIFDKGTVEDFWESVLELGRRTLAQLAAEALVRPIVTPIIAQVVGTAPQLFGLSGGAAAAAQAGAGGTGGTTSGVGGGDLLSLGSGFNRLGGDFLGIGSAANSLKTALNAFGANIGLFGSGVPVATGPGGLLVGGGATSSGAVATSGALGATTATQFLGGVGLGITAGTLFNNLLGGNQLGGTIGSAIGAAIGTAILPGIGSILGGLAGGGIGGLFGNNRPSVGPATRVNVDVVGGQARITGLDQADGGNVAASRQFGQAFADALNRLPELVGATGFRGGPAVSGADFGTLQGKVRLVQGGGVRVFDDPQEALDAALLGFLKGSGRDAFEDLSPAVRTALGRSQATTLEDLASDIDFARNLERVASGLTEAADELERIEDAAKAAALEQGEAIFEFRQRAQDLGLLNKANAAIDQAVDSLLNFVESEEEITQAERTIAALRGQFDGLKEVLEELGRDTSLADDAFDRSVDALREGFEEANALAVLHLTDPLAAALQEFDAVASARLREAEELGADLVDVERRNALERAQIIERFAQQSADSLQALLDSLRLGPGSPLSQDEQLAIARERFEAASQAALAGEAGGRDALLSAVQPFLDASRRFFGAGPGFAADFANAISVLEELANLPQMAGGGVTQGLAFAGEVTEGVVPLPDGRSIPATVDVRGLTDFTPVVRALDRNDETEMRVGRAIVDEVRELRGELRQVKSAIGDVEVALRTARPQALARVQ